MNLELSDIIVLLSYVLLIIGTSAWLLLKKGEGTAENYFVGGKALPFWVVGIALVAANISTIHFVGVSGVGYAVGVAIAAYEWMGAIALLVVAKYLLPVFIKKGVYTAPQYMEERFDRRVRGILAVCFMLMYVFVNMTAVLFLGGFALQFILGIPLLYCVLGLVFFTALYSVFGGLRVIVWTDIIHLLFVLISGGATLYFTLNAVSDGAGMLAGLGTIVQKAPGHFQMILDYSDDNYKYLPGISVIFGGMWVANIYYWGCNQFILQNSIAAKNLQSAQKGALLAAFIKIFIPILIVLPGIAVWALNAGVSDSDQAYPWLINNYLEVGWRGLAIAGIIAAAVSSLSTMANSTATIFTIDIVYTFLRPDMDDNTALKVGRTMSLVSLLLALVTAPFLVNIENAFQFVLDVTCYFSPGIVVLFLAGILWKRATAEAAFWVAILNIPVSMLIGFHLLPSMPFLDRMGLSTAVLSLILVGISMRKKAIEAPAGTEEEEGFPDELSEGDGVFKTEMSFNIIAILLVGLVALFFGLLW